MCESFHPHAPSNRHPRCYRKHELEKKQKYEQQVREIEHASFTLVFSNWWNDQQGYSWLATKWDQLYSSTMSWLRCWLTFSLRTLVSYQVHKGCLLQLWSCSQVPDSPIGSCLNLTSFKLAHFLLYSPVLLFYVSPH